MKKTIFCTIILFTFFLGSCGKSDSMSQVDNNLENEQETRFEYVLEETDLFSYGNVSIDNEYERVFTGFIDEDVYCICQNVKDGYIEKYTIYKIEDPYTDWTSIEVEVDDGLTQIPMHIGATKTMDESGNLHIIFTEEEHWYEEIISKDGKHQVLELQTDFFEGCNLISGWYINEGDEYIFADNQLFRCNSDFSNFEVVANFDFLFVQDIVNVKDDNSFYVLGSGTTGTIIYKYNISKHSLETIGKIFTDKIAWKNSSEGYGCSSLGICKLDLENGTSEQIEKFADKGMNPYKILDFVCDETGSFSILTSRMSGKNIKYSLIKYYEKEVKDKKQIVFGTVWAPPYLNEWVYEFNKQNDEYEVVISEMPEDVDWETYRLQVQMEISAGRGPDIIASTLMDFENEARSGYIIDLTDAFEEEFQYMLEKPLKLGQVDGKQFAMPISFSVGTLVGLESVLGERTSWSLEELMNITRTSGVSIFTEFREPVNNFYYLSAINNKRFIDWDQKICNLNGDEAIELLEFSKKYSDKEWLSYGDTLGEYYSLGVRTIRGEILTNDVMIYNMFEVTRWETLCSAIDDQPVFIGYPSENGENNCFLTDIVYAVNSSSSYMDEAIQFLKFGTSEYMQHKWARELEDNGPGFSIRKECFEWAFEQAKTNNYQYKYSDLMIDEKEIKLKELSQETVDKIYTMIENADIYDRRNDKIYDIFAEELEAYFVGQKSAQEVLDVVQNRVQLYMSETE